MARGNTRYSAGREGKATGHPVDDRNKQRPGKEWGTGRRKTFCGTSPRCASNWIRVAQENHDQARRNAEAMLLERMRRGDDSAFETLYERHMPPLYRYALRMTESQADADDVVQEAFLALIRNGRGYDPALGELRSYLYGIARRLIPRQQAAECVAEVEEVQLPVEDDPFERLDQEQRVSLVRAAVAALPANYREVIVLCDLEGESYEGAAGALGCALGTVRSRLHRARALLLERLERLKCRTS